MDNEQKAEKERQTETTQEEIIRTETFSGKKGIASSKGRGRWRAKDYYDNYFDYLHSCLAGLLDSGRTTGLRLVSKQTSLQINRYIVLVVTSMKSFLYTSPDFPSEGGLTQTFSSAPIFSGIQRLNALSPQHNNNWPFSPDIALCVSLTPERQMHYSFKIYHLHIHANVRAFWRPE